MTSSPTIASNGEQPTLADTASLTALGRKQPGRNFLVYVLVELLRLLAILVTAGLVAVLLSSGVAQLYVDIEAATSGDVEGLLPSLDALRSSWAEHQDLLIDQHIPATMWVTVTGLSIAIGFGVLLAAIMDLFAPLRWVLYPLIIISQTVPIFAVAVLLIILFGFNFGPKIIVVTLFCFFPITINTLSGLQSADPVHSNLLRSMGANRLQTWWKVRLPSAMPSFFSGLRIAATYSVVGAVIGEYVGSGDGLGKFLQRSYRSFDTDQAYLAIVVIAALSVMLVIFSMLIEVLVLRWRYIGLITARHHLQSLLNLFKPNS